LPSPAGAGLLTVLGGGAAFTAVEKHRSTWDGVWWAITTMTTVGYGDLSPATDWGRLIGIAVMLIGISLFAVFTGAVAQRFLAATVEEVEDIAIDAEATESEVLSELREVRMRLDRLERRLAQR